MDANLAAVEKTREDQRKNFSVQGDDPESQLKGLMSAQNSLHRLSTMANKPKEGKIKELA